MTQHPPTGTVTFLFTDIEGSTRLWEQDPDAMREALARHDVLLRKAIEAYAGYVFKTVGDAFCAAFARAPDALALQWIDERIFDLLRLNVRKESNLCKIRHMLPCVPCARWM